jgi:hypothetical protein
MPIVTDLENHEQIDRVKAILSNNPYKQEISQSLNQLENIKANIEGYESNILEYRHKIEKAKIQKTVEQQREPKLKNKITQLEALASQVPAKLDMFNVDTATSFFKSNGLRFINLKICVGSDYSQLYYVKPAFKIESLAVPPLLICINYKNNNGLVSFYSVDAQTAIHYGGSDHVIHPHISSGGSVCLGNYVDVMNDNNISLDINNYMDHVLLVNNLLSTYNPDSPYQNIAYIINKMLSKNHVTCGDKFLGTLSSNNFNLSDKYYAGLADYQGSFAFNPKFIFSQEELRGFYALTGDSTQVIKDYLQECIYDHGYILTFNDDSSRDMYDEACDVVKEFENLGVKLTNPDHYSILVNGDGYEYDEENDSESYDALEEDQFDNLMNRWVSQIRKYVTGEVELSPPKNVRLEDDEIDEFISWETILQERGDVLN